MSSPIAVILNVASGPDRQRARSDVADLLRKHQVPAELLTVEAGADVRTQAMQAVKDGYGTIVAAGGDGTVGAVAGVVAGTSSRLGVLPLGTFNHFAKDLGVPTDLDEAVHVLSNGRTKLVDIATVNGHTFVNTSSIGLYPRLVLHREGRRRFGYSRWVALWTAVISTLRRFDRVRVRLHSPDGAWEGVTPFVFVGNNPYVVEGENLASRLELDRGELCVCLTGKSGRWRILRMALNAWLGRLTDDPEFRMITTTELWVDTPRSALHVSLDGEVVILTSPLHYQIRPRVLKVAAP